MIKNIHFFVGQLTIGGIETYVYRVAKELKSKEVDITIWVIRNSKNKEFLLEVSKYAKINFINYFDKLAPVFIKPVALPLDTDLVIATGKLSLIYAIKSCKLLNRPVKLVTGVFSQWEFLPKINIYRYNYAKTQFIKKSPSNTFFCTDGCLEEHLKLSNDIHSSIVSPLLIDLDCYRSVNLNKPYFSSKSTIRITSIGRFTKFKKYNYQMPYIIRNIVDNGYSVHWNVYGDGSEIDNAKKIISETNTQAYITLHGTVSYSMLSKIFEETDLYIGSGTTLIESSASGVPSIIALDDEDNALSPGFFCDRNGFFTSDRKIGESLFKIESIIFNYITMPYEEKHNLSKKSIEKARQYSIHKAQEEYERIYKNALAIENFDVFNDFQDIFSILKFTISNKKPPINKTHN